MIARASGVLDWRKTKGRNVHRLGMVQNPAMPDGTNAVPIIVVYDTSRESVEALARALTVRTLDTFMLKRAQMLQ
jgi:hypothetical protein